MVSRRKRALAIATVGQSLRFQAPSAWEVLREQGYGLTFAARQDEHLEALGSEADLRPLPLDRRLSPRVLIRARSALRKLMQEDWDLIQVQTPIAAALVRSMQLPERAATIYVAHGFHFHRDQSFLRNAPYLAVELALAGRTTGLAVVANEDQKAAERLGMARRTRVWRLPGAGVDLSLFAPDDGAQSLHDVPYAVFCGELNSNKDPLLAISVIRGGREDGTLPQNFRLIMIGSGPLEAQIRSLQLPWVELINNVPPVRVAEYMRQAQFLISTSSREGLPRVLIESLATNVPVIARENRGSRELLVGHPMRGQLVSENRPAAWHQALQEVVKLRPVISGRREMEQYSTASFARSYGALLAEVEHLHFLQMRAS